MKRSLWLLMLFLLAGHVPAASADSACEGRFVNPITDICWSCIFPLSLGSIKVSQGKVPDTANPSMPIQICPAPPPLFRRIGLAIGYWEPMALTVAATAPSTRGQSARTSLRSGMDSSTISAVITAEPMSMRRITPSSE